ncbi:MAG: O-antigen ligase family protein [Erythrobacter sp.]|nr:O-antigen ligase family protein [Erythrobacter sp.]
MLDLILLAFIGYILVLGIKRPFLWVLLYIYIDILAPQRIGYGIITSLPVSLIAFAAAFGGWLALDRKKGARFSLRQGLIALLMVYCWWTTGHADFPVEAGTKWDWVWKAMLFAIFLPLTLTTRLRIEAAVLTMLLAMSVIIIGAGIKVVFGGGGYGTRLLIVDDNFGIYESSVLACMSIAIIPLIFWFTRHGQIFPPDWRVKLFGAGFILACTLIPVGTEARTGLVCFAVLLMLTFWHMKHKAVFAGLGAMALVAAVPFLPASFTDRMGTITNFEQDQSASTRVAVWSWTLDYVHDKPFGGGFDAYRGNSFKYRMRVEEQVGTSTVVRYADVVDEARAYHSAIFEVLGEQGYPGLIIWSLLQLSGLWSMARIHRHWKNREGPGNQWQAPMALALGQAQIIYLVGALFTGIAYTPPMLILIAFQIGLANYLKPFGAQPSTAQPQIDHTQETAPNLASAPLATGKPA